MSSESTKICDCNQGRLPCTCKAPQQATGYTAVDMTTAAAQGFRDGAASVVVELPDYDSIVFDRALDIPAYAEINTDIMRQVYQSLHRQAQAAIIAAGGSVKE